MKRQLAGILLILAMIASTIACWITNKTSGATSTPQGSKPTQAAQSPQPSPTRPLPTSTNSPQSTTMPTLSGDPASIAANAIQILPTLSYRKREWVMDSQGNPPDPSQPPALIAEFTPPDNAYLVMGDIEYLALNGNFYSRKSGEAWAPYAWVTDVPGAVSQSSAINLPPYFTQALQKGELTIQAAGTDSIAGVWTQVFQASGEVDFGGTPMAVDGKVWIGGDGRLLKMELDQPDSGAQIYLSLYEYDPDIQMPNP